MKDGIDWQARRAFYATDLGKLLRRFENALASAWRYDGMPHASESAMQKAFNQADAARSELIAALQPEGAK